MQQLKDALLKAGLVGKEKLKEIQKEKVLKRHLQTGKKVKADQIQIVCEVCRKSTPDVERYIHKNRRIENKEWLCIDCADEYQIMDDHRVTNQSVNARRGLFSRRYGRTKKFPKEK